jgi:hypothetical protein
VTELAVNGDHSRPCSRNRGLERRNTARFRNENGIGCEIMYIHTYIHIDRQTDIHTDTHTYI